MSQIRRAKVASTGRCAGLYHHAHRPRLIAVEAAEFKLEINGHDAAIGQHVEHDYTRPSSCCMTVCSTLST